MSTLIETDGACPRSRVAKLEGKQTQIAGDIDVSQVRRRKLVNAERCCEILMQSPKKKCLISSSRGEN